MINNFEQLFEYLELAGDKCLIFHPEKGAYVVVKAEVYKKLVSGGKQEKEAGQSKGSPFPNPFKKPNADLNYYEIERKVLEADEYFPESV